MSKPVKNGGTNPDVSFEEALKKLETIVESMESEDLPLENLMARFEEGTNLAKLCQTKLAEAELKIQRLEKEVAKFVKRNCFSDEDFQTLRCVKTSFRPWLG